ncbi:hypothetical protein [Rhodovarius crocodyli]|nr:hypothetical protein [Rhodovarius crocodyli]
MSIRLMQADHGIQQFQLKIDIATLDVIQDRNEVIRLAKEGVASLLQQMVWRVPLEGEQLEAAVP